MSQALASGAFLTTVQGRSCTAVPKPGSKAANAQGNNNGGGNNDSADSVAQTTAAITTSKNSQSTTTSTSQITTTSTTSSSTSSTSLAQLDTTTDVALQAAVSEPPPESSPPTSPTALTFSQAAPSQTSQPPPPPQTILSSAKQTSQADTSKTTASEAAAQATIQQFSEIDVAPTATDGVNGQFTTIGTAPSNNPAEQSTDATSSTNGAISAVPVSNGNTVQSTVAVAGGVIGGVVALSTIAFFIWWWRRRMVKRRRSTLLTPLTVDNLGRPTGGGEKGSYEINRSSIGPTPVAEKVRNAIGYNVKMIRGRVSRIVTRNNSTSSPSVNMNRGNSQFMDPASSHSRANSSALSGGGGADVTSKDRFLDWWSRLTADANFNWRLRNKDPNPRSGSSRGMNEKKGNTGSATQPDFLTLLGMDERELDREAQRRRASVARKAGSAGSADHFLGGLNLSFSGNNNNSPDDPFNDANALPRSSAKPAPLVVSQANNPFSDSNAIRNPAGPKPNTYVADMRRSRNQSIGGGNSWPAPGAGYRESTASVESYTTRRNNKFRSDPFDLERPELLASARQAKASMSSSTAGTAGSSDWPPRNSRLGGGVGTGEIRRPPGAHQRSESFSSKYSSGVSMGDWSDPGPDVGPAASRKDGPEARESPTQAWRNRIERDAAKAALKRSPSAGSNRSVGKAM